MPFDPWESPYDRLMQAAEQVADERPDVDREMAREVFVEAATLLHDGLVLNGLDEHDTAAALDALAVDLVSSDPGEAIRERAHAVVDSPSGLHDPEAVSASLLVTAALFGL